MDLTKHVEKMLELLFKLELPLWLEREYNPVVAHELLLRGRFCHLSGGPPRSVRRSAGSWADCNRWSCGGQRQSARRGAVS